MKPAPNEFAAEIGGAPVAVTQGVMESFKPSEVNKAVQRHLNLDWGDMSADDAHANLRAAMEGGGRVLGAYRIRASSEMPCDLWILTESDRSHTTIMLPDEY